MCIRDRPEVDGDHLRAAETGDLIGPIRIADSAFAGAGAAKKIDHRDDRRSRAELGDLPHAEQPVTALDAQRVGRKELADGLARGVDGSWAVSYTHLRAHETR